MTAVGIVLVTHFNWGQSHYRLDTADLLHVILNDFNQHF